MPHISPLNLERDGDLLEGLADVENVTLKEISCKDFGMDISNIIDEWNISY